MTVLKSINFFLYISIFVVLFFYDKLPLEHVHYSITLAAVQAGIVLTTAPKLQLSLWVFRLLIGVALIAILHFVAALLTEAGTIPEELSMGVIVATAATFLWTIFVDVRSTMKKNAE